MATVLNGRERAYNTFKFGVPVLPKTKKSLSGSLRCYATRSVAVVVVVGITVRNDTVWPTLNNVVLQLVRTATTHSSHQFVSELDRRVAEGAKLNFTQLFELQRR